MPLRPRSDQTNLLLFSRATPERKPVKVFEDNPRAKRSLMIKKNFSVPLPMNKTKKSAIHKKKNQKPNPYCDAEACKESRAHVYATERLMSSTVPKKRRSHGKPLATLGPI